MKTFCVLGAIAATLVSNTHGQQQLRHVDIGAQSLAGLRQEREQQCGVLPQGSLAYNQCMAHWTDRILESFPQEKSSLRMEAERMAEAGRADAFRSEISRIQRHSESEQRHSESEQRHSESEQRHSEPVQQEDAHYIVGRGQPQQRPRSAESPMSPVDQNKDSRVPGTLPGSRRAGKQAPVRPASAQEQLAQAPANPPAATAAAVVFTTPGSSAQRQEEDDDEEEEEPETTVAHPAVATAASTASVARANTLASQSLVAQTVFPAASVVGAEAIVEASVVLPAVKPAANAALVANTTPVAQPAVAQSAFPQAAATQAAAAQAVSAQTAVALPAAESASVFQTTPAVVAATTIAPQAETNALAQAADTVVPVAVADDARAAFAADSSLPVSTAADTLAVVAETPADSRLESVAIANIRSTAVIKAPSPETTAAAAIVTEADVDDDASAETSEGALAAVVAAQANIQPQKPLVHMVSNTIPLTANERLGVSTNSAEATDTPVLTNTATGVHAKSHPTLTPLGAQGAAHALGIVNPSEANIAHAGMRNKMNAKANSAYTQAIPVGLMLAMAGMFF
ncbi:hypothetical protein GGF46_002407 [Coemansia sp. RSA 552]|nr:hypothetical protein GGF46_002407 [Coemansia sp. RSA 552]